MQGRSTKTTLGEFDLVGSGYVCVCSVGMANEEYTTRTSNNLCLRVLRIRVDGDRQSDVVLEVFARNNNLRRTVDRCLL